MTAHLGLIGGSGLDGLPLDGAAWRDVPTPWGAPSDEILTGILHGVMTAPEWRDPLLPQRLRTVAGRVL